MTCSRLDSKLLFYSELLFEMSLFIDNEIFTVFYKFDKKERKKEEEAGSQSVSLSPFSEVTVSTISSTSVMIMKLPNKRLISFAYSLPDVL